MINPTMSGLLALCIVLMSSALAYSQSSDNSRNYIVVNYQLPLSDADVNHLEAWDENTAQIRTISAQAGSDRIIIVPGKNASVDKLLQANWNTSQNTATAVAPLAVDNKSADKPLPSGSGQPTKVNVGGDVEGAIKSRNAYNDKLVKEKMELLEEQQKEGTKQHPADNTKPKTKDLSKKADTKTTTNESDNTVAEPEQPSNNSKVVKKKHRQRPQPVNKVSDKKSSNK